MQFFFLNRLWRLLKNGHLPVRLHSSAPPGGYEHDVGRKEYIWTLSMCTVFRLMIDSCKIMWDSKSRAITQTIHTNLVGLLCDAGYGHGNRPVKKIGLLNFGLVIFVLLCYANEPWRHIFQISEKYNRPVKYWVFFAGGNSISTEK